MKRLTWLKFYPADWQSDQALGSCSLAARGLWMELLAIMHRADTYGHLLVNDKAPTDTQLASLARCPLDQIPSLLDELESAGVFSRTRSGVIYSRRLSRDEKKRRDGEKAQKLGGKVPGSRRHKAAENKEENAPPPGVVVGVVEQPPNHLEAREEKKEKEERTILRIDAEASPPPDPDNLNAALFGPCLRFLMANGSEAKPARSVIGKWRKDFGDMETVAAFREAQTAAASEPVAYIAAVLQRRRQARSRTDTRVFGDGMPRPCTAI